MVSLRKVIVGVGVAAMGVTASAQTTRLVAPSSELTKAVAENDDRRKEMEAYGGRMKHLDELIKEYDRRYEQGATDKANELIDEIIAAAPVKGSPFGGGGEAYLGQAGYGILSDFTNRLLQRGQNQQAIKIITANPDTRPAENLRLYPPETATSAEHMQFAAMVWGWSQKNDYWIHVYFRYLSQIRRARELLQPGDQLQDAMEQEVRKAPADFDAARRYAVAMAAWRRPSAVPARPASRGQCDWMGDLCRPPNASDYILLGKAILATNSPEGASRLLKAGLAAPLTKVDAEYARRQRMLMSAVPDRVPSDEEIVRGQIRQDLMHCLKLAGHGDEVTAMMKQEGRLPAGREAGKLDAGKANPQFEKTILDAEAQRGNSPEHWIDRADYYAMRPDMARAESAWQRAMEMAKPEGTKGAVTKSWVLGRYVYFLAYVKRDHKAGYEKLWAESKGFPPETMTRLLQGYDPIRKADDLALGDDSRLWKWLEDCPVWQIAHMRVIEAMLQKPGIWTRDQVIVASGKLARANDTTRAAALGDALTMVARDATWRKKDVDVKALYQAAVEVLEEAMPRGVDRSAGDSYAQKSCLKRLLADAYEQLEQWKKLLALYPETEAGTGDYPSRHLALIAAKAGDKVLAIRQWDRSLAVRPDKSSVQAMAAAGCREELILSARRALEGSPQNDAAKDVLTWLGEPIQGR